MSRRTTWTALALPVGAAALVVGASLLPRSTTDPAGGPQRVDVVQSTYACPAGSVVTVGSGQLEPGERRDFRVTPEREVDDAASDAGRWTTSRIAGDGVIVTQTGRESGAVGFFAGVAGKAGGGGLVVGHCGSIVDDAWFLGLGTADERSSTLILSNMSDTPAVADLRLWGPEGEIDAVDATGIALDPYTVRRIPVADLAAGEPALALQVARRRGLLSAVVNDGSTATFAGTEPIGATAAPSTDQYLPGVESGRRGKTLLLLNPGDRTARVDVESLASDGPVSDRRLQGVKVPAGRFVEVDVPTSAPRGRQALHVSSDEPVAASVRVEPGTKDYSVVEAGAALDGPAVVPVELGRSVSAPRLLLTAPGDDASVTVTAYDDRMRSIGSADTAVPGRSTVTLDTADVTADGDVAYLVVTPKGRVVGAATYADGSLVSSLLLESAPTRIEVPQVVPVD